MTGRVLVAVPAADLIPDNTRPPCAGLDTSHFFLADEERLVTAWDRLRATAYARCAPCPLRRACLAAGKSGGEDGLWGGTLFLDSRGGTGRRRVYNLLDPAVTP